MGDPLSLVGPCLRVPDSSYLRTRRLFKGLKVAEFGFLTFRHKVPPSVVCIVSQEDATELSKKWLSAVSATNGSSKQLTVICEHWHRRHRPSYFFVLTFKSHILKKILYPCRLQSLAMYGGSYSAHRTDSTTDVPRDSAPPSVCSFNVRAMRKASNAESPSAVLNGHRIWTLKLKVEGFTNVSDIGQICQEVRQMLPNAGWR